MMTSITTLSRFNCRFNKWFNSWCDVKTPIAAPLLCLLCLICSASSASWAAEASSEFPAQSLEQTQSRQDRNIARSWLPQSQDDRFRDSLFAVGEHAQQREQCSQILEAKMADNYSPSNPKYIVTCRQSRRNTINLVYYQSDIDSNFAEIQQQENQQLDPRLVARLNEDCTTALVAKFNATAPDVSAISPTIKERSIGNFALFYDYTEGSGDFQLDFTITCLVNDARPTKIDIFPR